MIVFFFGFIYSYDHIFSFLRGNGSETDPNLVVKRSSYSYVSKSGPGPSSSGNGLSSKRPLAVRGLMPTQGSDSSLNTQNTSTVEASEGAARPGLADVVGLDSSLQEAPVQHVAANPHPEIEAITPVHTAAAVKTAAPESPAYENLFPTSHVAASLDALTSEFATCASVDAIIVLEVGEEEEEAPMADHQSHGYLQSVADEQDEELPDDEDLFEQTEPTAVDLSGHHSEEHITELAADENSGPVPMSSEWENATASNEHPASDITAAVSLPDNATPCPHSPERKTSSDRHEEASPYSQALSQAIQAAHEGASNHEGDAAATGEEGDEDDDEEFEVVSDRSAHSNRHFRINRSIDPATLTFNEMYDDATSTSDPSGQQSPEAEADLDTSEFCTALEGEEEMQVEQGEQGEKTVAEEESHCKEQQIQQEEDRSADDITPQQQNWDFSAPPSSGKDVAFSLGKDSAFI